MKRTNTMLITTVILSIALTSVFAFDLETTQTTSLDFQLPFTADAISGVTHDITMEAVAMPDGLYAYRMVSYVVGGEQLVGTQYSGKPSIPGPTIIMTEGDDANVTLINSACENNFVDGPGHPLDGSPVGPLSAYSENSMLGVHVHGVHYDITDDASYARMNMNNDSGALCGDTIEYHWVASPGTSGAWPYHDHTFAINEVGAEELGLFGTLIVNPGHGKVNGLVNATDGTISTVDVDDIDKDFILWMVSSESLGRSIFYGNEIDYDTETNYAEESGIRETALWTNPNLITTHDGIYRFHVLGLGEETHAFHMHGHRWTEEINDSPAAIEDIIDVKEIVPLQRHTFIIKASDNAGADDGSHEIEGWMYHCHFVDHMKQGMTGMMSVSDNSDDLPIIGATFTLSDEPGLWMKTLDAGVADELDNTLASLGLIEARNGTGFPLGYISDALEASPASAGTKFSTSEGRSLAVINQGETVLFGMKDSQTKHTITALIYPEAAQPASDKIGGNGILSAAGLGFFDTQLGIRGSTFITDGMGQPMPLDVPGLYVFVCKIHPYMFSAVVVDNPDTHLQLFGDSDLDFPLLDFSGNLTVLVRAESDNGNVGFPTYVGPTSDLAGSLLTTFYVITDPNNWKDYTQTSWNVSLPPVLVTTDTEEIVAGLPYTTMQTSDAATALGLTTSTGVAPTIIGLELGNDNIAIPDVKEPKKDGIGEVWVNTQFERTSAKNFDGTPADKPGTITVIDAKNWEIEQKIALPEINMNHPHNLWADAKNEVIYQTQWFGSEMAIIDRDSGELIKEVYTGQSPSHVMTSPADGKIYVAMNGEDTVNEFDPVSYELTKQISTGFRSHPHGHWISSSGQYVVTPDFLGLKASIIDLDSNTVKASEDLLLAPIATGMKGDESVFYTADFLGNTNTAIDPSDGSTLGQIDWLQAGSDFGVSNGLLGLPIQTPISPDDKWMVTALTLGGQIGVVDVSTVPGTVVAVLPCEPGCHGVQWGAQKDGGYYAYVTSKFANVMHVVDPDPNNDGDGTDAEIAGSIVLTKEFDTDIDDRIIGYAGQGGQGVLAIPNVYEGWIQQTIQECSDSKGKLKSDLCGKDVTRYLKDLKKSHLDPLDSGKD